MLLSLFKLEVDLFSFPLRVRQLRGDDLLGLIIALFPLYNDLFPFNLLEDLPIP